MVSSQQRTQKKKPDKMSAGLSFFWSGVSGKLKFAQHSRAHLLTRTLAHLHTRPLNHSPTYFFTPHSFFATFSNSSAMSFVSRVFSGMFSKTAYGTLTPFTSMKFGFFASILSQSFVL